MFAEEPFSDVGGVGGEDAAIEDGRLESRAEERHHPARSASSAAVAASSFGDEEPNEIALSVSDTSRT